MRVILTATQTKNLLSSFSPFGGGVGGGDAQRKCKEIFGFARASLRARSRRSQWNRGVRFSSELARAPRVRSGFEQGLISHREPKAEGEGPRLRFSSATQKLAAARFWSCPRLATRPAGQVPAPSLQIPSPSRKI